MGKSYLILRLEGALQSWGMRGRWDQRDSGSEPTKSGIMGLLGCALGYGMNDPRLEELDRQFSMGIRVEQEGVRLTDYHTVNAYPEESANWRSAEGSLKKEGIVSYRDYLQDASFLVVLEGEAELVDACAKAVQAPVWPYYLGRKSCIPTRPVFEAVRSDFSSIFEAISSCPWIGDAAEGQVILRYVADSTQGKYVRNDRIRSNRARTYGFRNVEIGEVSVGVGTMFKNEMSSSAGSSE